MVVPIRSQYRKPWFLMISIRNALPSDASFVKSCAEAAYDIYVERMGQKPAPMIADFGALIAKGQVDILEVEKVQVGYAIWHLKCDHLFLENIALHPDYQGKGLARHMLAHLEASARKANKDAIELYTNIKMTENLALYPRLGYLETDRRNEDGFDRVYYRKEL